MAYWVSFIVILLLMSPPISFSSCSKVEAWDLNNVIVVIIIIVIVIIIVTITSVNVANNSSSRHYFHPDVKPDKLLRLVSVETVYSAICIGFLLPVSFHTRLILNSKLKQCPDLKRANDARVCCFSTYELVSIKAFSPAERSYLGICPKRHITPLITFTVGINV